MRIKMLESRSGWPDAHTYHWYDKGETYDIPDSLAAEFVNKGYGTEIADAEDSK